MTTGNHATHLDLQPLDRRIDKARGSAGAEPAKWPLLEDTGVRALGCVDDRVADGRPVRMLATEDGHGHVLEATSIEVRAQLPGDTRGVLMRDQAHIHLGERLRRRDRLHARIGPAGADARDVAGRPEGVSDLRRPAGETAHELADCVDALDFLLLEGKRTQVIQLLLSG